MSTVSLMHGHVVLFPVMPSGQPARLFSAEYSAKKMLLPPASVTTEPVVCEVALSVLAAESVGSITWHEVVLQMS